MGRAIIFMVLGIGILFTLSSVRMSKTGLSSEDNVNANFAANTARNIAKSGIELAIMQLDSNKYWRSGYTNFSMSNGTLDLSAQTIDTSNVRVYSTGNYGGVSKLITATIYIPADNSTLPAAFGPAIMCDQDFTLNGGGGGGMGGGVNIVVYNPAEHINSDIHSNRRLTMNGNVNIKGYATYTTQFICNPLSKVTQFITPNYVIPGKPLYQQVSAIPIPVLNVNAERTKPGTTVLSTGDYTLTGNLSMGSATNPARYWVGGNITFNGQVSGYGIFIVGGSVTLNGGSTLNYPPPSNMNNLAVYANGSVTLNGDSRMTAQILTNESLTMNGNTILVGNAIVKQSITLNGTGLVKYLPANSVLTSSVWPGEVRRPDLTSYWE